MNPELYTLLGTAATLGFIHTVVGPDHYVPFVAMARAGRWGRMKTLYITILSGIGHVGSSVILGAIGIAVGTALSHLTWVESVRGEVAAWLLTGFGLAYMVWGIWRGIRSRPHTHTHTHTHTHADGEVHSHTHDHHAAHAHPHGQAQRANLTPWIIFSIFVFGPCEPLIPLLMYPAAIHSSMGVALVSVVFALTTITTMTAMVFLGVAGVELIPFPRLERYIHALAGGIIALSGISVLFLGL